MERPRTTHLFHPALVALLATLLTACATAPPNFTSSMSLKPMPAHIKPLSGHFVLTSGTPLIAHGVNAYAAGVAHEFAQWAREGLNINLDVFSTSHGSATRSRHIEFYLNFNNLTAPPHAGYRLTIRNGHIRLVARNLAGLHNGAVILYQLLAANEAPGRRVTVPNIAISDELPGRLPPPDVAAAD